MLTYPRTDSRALPEDYLPVVRQTLGNLAGSLQSHAQKVLENDWVRPNKRIFNNAQISDHFAIIPTASEAKNLDDAEAKIYRHGRAALRGGVLSGGGIRCHDAAQPGRRAQVQNRRQSPDSRPAGWKSMGRAQSMKIPTQGKALPALSAEDKNQAKTLEANLHAEATKPPPRYTEATLLSAMETAGKLVEDEELAEAMKERGLGTPATRADTIDGLIYQKYMRSQSARAGADRESGATASNSSTP